MAKIYFLAATNDGLDKDSGISANKSPSKIEPSGAYKTNPASRIISKSILAACPAVVR